MVLLLFYQKKKALNDLSTIHKELDIAKLKKIDKEYDQELVKLWNTFLVNIGLFKEDTDFKVLPYTQLKELKKPIYEHYDELKTQLTKDMTKKADNLSPFVETTIEVTDKKSGEPTTEPAIAIKEEHQGALLEFVNQAQEKFLTVFNNNLETNIKPIKIEMI